MAAAQSCPCSLFMFFPHYNDTHLRNNLRHFPFCPLYHSLLRRHFCSYAATDRRRRRRNQWDSNAETIRAKDFSFKLQDDYDQEEEEECDDEEMASSGILEDAIDSIWILKVFRSYGWALPPILLSLLIATGPKAFLMALALPLGQSAITLVFQKLFGRPQSRKKHKARVSKKTKNKYERTVKNTKMKEDVSQGQNDRKEMKDYQSWANDGVPVNEGGQDSSSFGGWDELDGMRSIRMSSTVTNGSTRTTKEKSKLTEKESITDDEPLLLRLLIAVFPFLGSWTKMFC